MSADFIVNGQAVATEAAGSTPLLYVLRNELKLKGTRHGCTDGDCGACTVIVDGRAENACLLSVEAASGTTIETVESLDTGDDEHPLVAAFLKEQAGQCGYCVAGILMRAKAFLANASSPTRRDIAKALEGHLCRCGAHNRILRAIEQAAEGNGR